MAALDAPLLGHSPEGSAVCSDRWETKRSEELAACTVARRSSIGREGPSSRVAEAAMTVLSGMLLWLMTLALAVGFATFAFLAMPSETHLAISMQVLGTSICYLWLGMRSKNPASCVQASPIPAIYISIFIKACEAAGLEDPARISTVLSFVWLATLAQGLAFVVCSRYHMGDVLQYFPVSVTTGYNGGIGLLILNASISMMAGVNPLEDMEGFLKPGPLCLALPGTLLALVVYPLSLYCTGPAFKVLPILTTIVVFYLVLPCTGTSLAQARDEGWIFPYYGFSKPTDVLTIFDYTSIDWTQLGHGATLVPPMTLISMIAQYASLGAILLQVAESTKDADEETRHLGQATAVSALVGSMPNLSGMAPSALLLGVVGKRGARGAVLVICGLLHLVLFVSGFPLVSYLPKCSIAGCLLLPISFKMIRGALLESLAFSTWGDYVVIWVMSWTTLMANIQWGLSAGFILSVFRLLYEYAHFSVVDRRESLAEVLTLKGRDGVSKEVLKDHGEEVAGYRLKGVLFFGNCVSLKLELNALFDGAGAGEGGDGVCRPPPKFVVVDFSEVVYVDSSVWEIMASATQRAAKVSSTEIYLCGLSGELFAELMRQGGKLLEKLNLSHVQHAYLLTLEQIEDQILEIAEVPEPKSDGWEQFTAWIASFLPQGLQAGQALERSRLERYFEEVEYEPGDSVQRERAAAMAFYWVMSGEFHIFAEGRNVKQDLVPGSAPQLQTPLAKKLIQRKSTHRKASKEARLGMALLYGKLTQGYTAGGEVFCQEATLGGQAGSRTASIKPMQAYTSLQCKHAGRLLRLAREDFERLRDEDPQLCVAVLLAVASRREVQLRSHMLYQYEPAEVEVVDGFRRRFTMPTSSDKITEAIGIARYNPMKSMALLVDKGFSSLQKQAIRMQDRRAHNDHPQPTAHTVAGF